MTKAEYVSIPSGGMTRAEAEAVAERIRTENVPEHTVTGLREIRPGEWRVKVNWYHSRAEWCTPKLLGFLDVEEDVA